MYCVFAPYYGDSMTVDPRFFLLLVEERGLLGKFGQEYVRHQQNVPMLAANAACLFKVLSSPGVKP